MNDERGLDKVPVQELGLGMYVAKLDKDWLDSSFPIQGFYVRNDTVRERLQAECTYVYVDPRRFKRMDNRPQLRVVVSNDNPSKNQQGDAKPQRNIALEFKHGGKDPQRGHQSAQDRIGAFFS